MISTRKGIAVMFRKLCIFSLFLLLSGCVTVPVQHGTVIDGRYVAPDGSISVEVPNVAEVQVTDGKNGQLQYADFMPNNNEWARDSGYSIEWFQLTKRPDRTLLIALPEEMRNNIEWEGGRIEDFQCHYITVRRVYGYQCIAIGEKDRIPAIMVGTSMVRAGYLINASVITPHTKPRLTVDQQIPWWQYNRYIDSIRVLPPQVPQPVITSNKP